MRTLGLIKKNSINLAKQTINLDSVNVDQIEYPTNLSIVMMVLNITLVTKKVTLLKHYVLSYLKWGDT